MTQDRFGRDVMCRFCKRRSVSVLSFWRYTYYCEHCRQATDVEVITSENGWKVREDDQKEPNS